ncbi:LPXTG cell wall anchor domain-containing protein [Enterococcus sp. 5B3_DIV0040]|uniref:LPXTG cell wall anchor domain-containing protein n=1 Tax=Enterococcus sp. 5B3_DIV0040 TaxID=1834182 RepID=UPI000A32F67C|nr:LPXTG cell wall anchor domain-containing protein [Enterococcus sp. 5B3_DIV0040]
MKKILFLSLFSTTILLGTVGVSASAEETTTDSGAAVTVPSEPVVPSEPTPTTPSVETPTDPVVPPTSGEESQPTVPVDPGTSGTEVPDTPDVPVTPPDGGGETPGTTPTDPGTSTTETPGTTEAPGSTTDSSTTEQPTTSSTSEEVPETPKEEPNQPAEEPKEDKETEPKENKPAAPAKEVTVSVDASGNITTGAAQGTSVPIVTSDVKELTHIPTPTTPLKAASGQTIVGVKDGVPLVQDSQGNLIEDVSIPVKKLPSGNIEVKTADGKTKVLPKTGEEIHAALSILGVIMTSIAGFFGYKKHCKG